MISNRLNNIFICLGFILVSSLFSCSFTLNEQVYTVSSEVEAREIAFAKTMADRDFDAFLNFISPEAVFFTGNKPQKGLDAIDFEDLQESRKRWIEEALESKSHNRESKWTESNAVGSECFVEAHRKGLV